MNIDPVGCDVKHAMENTHRISNIVHEYFGENAVINIPKSANFSKAFLWVWESANNGMGDYLFQLEEDWRLDIPIDFNRMMQIMEEDLSIAHLRLSYKLSTDTCKNWKHFLDWNGKFFEVKESERGMVGFCGHPSINRKNFTRDAVSNIDVRYNPEKQMKHNFEWFRKWMGCKFGCFHPQNSPPAIHDTGRKWMIEHGWAKSGNKAWFTEWEKV